MRLPDGDGIDLVRLIGERYPDLPVAVITAHGSMESAIAALKAGAFDFVSKPVDLGILRRLVDSALRLRQQPATPAGAPARGGLPELLGDSPPMVQVRAPHRQAGAQSGAGPHQRRIRHRQGAGGQADPRAEPAGGAAVRPRELRRDPPRPDRERVVRARQGQLHRRARDKTGLFQAADGGTLFLDEVADLPLAHAGQAAAGHSGKGDPAGGRAAREIPVDVRVLSATHQDLAALVAAGAFRQDLYYRINVIGLRMPPLRERPEDVPPLVDAILGRLARAQDRSAPRLEAAALRRLLGYGFPGNVRELENILERAVALCEGDTITSADLGLPESGDEVRNPVRVPAGDQGTSSAEHSATLNDHLQGLERQAILKALEETRWNRTAAARKLGISFRQLRYRLEKLGL